MYPTMNTKQKAQKLDHGVKENMIVEGRSTTSVDLRNLHTGVEYEATIRGFSV